MGILRKQVQNSVLDCTHTRISYISTVKSKDRRGKIIYGLWRGITRYESSLDHQRSFFFVVVVEAASHSLKIRATYPQGEGTPYNSEYGIFFFRLQFMPAFIPPPPEKKAVKTDIQGGREKASFCQLHNKMNKSKHISLRKHEKNVTKQQRQQHFNDLIPKDYKHFS